MMKGILDTIPIGWWGSKMAKYRVVLIVQDYVDANSQDEAVEIANLEMENGEIIADRLDEESDDD